MTRIVAAPGSPRMRLEAVETPTQLRSQVLSACRKEPWERG